MTSMGKGNVGYRIRVKGVYMVKGTWHKGGRGV